MWLGKYLKNLGNTLSDGYKLWKDTGRYTEAVKEDTLPEGFWGNLFGSADFYERTAKAVERTRETGRETAYEIRKEIKGNRHTLTETTDGSAHSVKSAHNVGNLKDYGLASFHVHPVDPGAYLFPSYRDLRALNRQNRMTKGKYLSLIAIPGESQAQVIAIRQKGKLPPLPFRTKRLSREIFRNFDGMANEGSSEHPLFMLAEAIKKTGRYTAVPIFLDYADGRADFDEKALKELQ